MQLQAINLFVAYHATVIVFSLRLALLFGSKLVYIRGPLVTLGAENCYVKYDLPESPNPLGYMVSFTAYS